jgi:hypothetical protein
MNGLIALLQRRLEEVTTYNLVKTLGGCLANSLTFSNKKLQCTVHELKINK